MRVTRVCWVSAVLLGCGTGERAQNTPDAAVDASLEAGADSTIADADAAASPPDATDGPAGAVADANVDAVADANDDAEAAAATEASTTSEGGDGGLPPRACDPHCVDVLTWHNDNARTGQNLTETLLTPDNVDAAQFGRLFTLPVDGKVDAQPLYVSALDVAGRGTHNVVFVATEHDSLYAFDADSNAGDDATPLWQVSLLRPGSGETPSEARLDCDQVMPEIGVTSTPVIDMTTRTLYVVAMSKVDSGTYAQRLHAIDIASGAERAGSPVDIEGVYPGTAEPNVDGGVLFDPGLYKERAALLLVHGTLYLSWASHCDTGNYTGWIMAYDPASLAQRGLLNVTPNGGAGAFWGSGAGPSSDANGNVYLLGGNGTFDTTLDPNGMPAQGDFGNAMLKLPAGSMTVGDYFAAFDTVAQSGADLDFGSGGAVVLPDEVGSPAHPHLIVGAGKDGNIYLVDRDHMGKWNGVDGGTDNAQIVQELVAAVPGREFGAPAYFDHALYYGDNGQAFKRFAIDGAHVDETPTTTSSLSFAYPGVTPSISADGTAADRTKTAVVWGMLNANPAVLRAYTALDLTTPIYTSEDADGGRDSMDEGNKFIVPTVANGRVYAATVDAVYVFGLL